MRARFRGIGCNTAFGITGATFITILLLSFLGTENLPLKLSHLARHCALQVTHLGLLWPPWQAYDIRTGVQAFAVSNIQVVCYTFAMLRTGNHAFAQNYNATVPDTWSALNDQVSSLCD